MIKKVRRDVLALIEANKSNEITRDSDNQRAGVYMLYVDCFEDQSIVPFYIGQTSNFQDRHKQHFTEILSLNRLKWECYQAALFADLYNGRNRACKIFSYMANHRCTLSDLHMIVLEEVGDDAARLKRENELIEQLKAPFFGFNQLNTVLQNVEYMNGKISKKELIDTAKMDIELMLQLPECGYSVFNWYRAGAFFQRIINAEMPNQEICSVYSDVLGAKERLEQIRGKLIEIRAYNRYQAQEKLWEICKDTIADFFSTRKLKSIDKQKLIVRVLLFDFEDDRNTLEKYFAKYAERIGENIFDILVQVHGVAIQPIKEKVLSNQDEYCRLEKEQEKLKSYVFGTLLPEQYDSHPLGALPEKLHCPIKGDEDNICYLNVEYTCYRVSRDENAYPQICRIDYWVTKEGILTSRTAYIENDLLDFFDCGDVYYLEKGGPFSPYLIGGVGTHIPVSMEYKNGINEWTLRDVQAEDFRKVFKEIDCLIDDGTKIIYTTSGYKSTLLRFADIPGIKNLRLMKKLKRLYK